MAAGNPPAVNAIIAASASLSDVIDLAGGRLAMIFVPDTWTTANLTFQCSQDGETFKNLFDSSGTEYTVTASGGRAILVPMVDFLGIRFLKVRSGTSGTAVNQTAARQIVLVMVP